MKNKLLLLPAMMISLSSSFAQPLYGVNLAGAEFGEHAIPGQNNKDYVYPGDKSLDYFHGKGVKLVRLPFLWERVQPTMNGELDKEQLEYLDKFIASAKTRNMKVIIDVHNYARRDVGGTKFKIGTPEVPRAAFTDFWIKLAKHFKDETSIYGYGLVNEPHDMKTCSWVKTSQEAINGIRTVDKKHTVIVGGNDWSSADRWPQSSDSLKFVIDPADNMLFEAHVYFDRDASGVYKLAYKIDGVTPNTGVERASHFIDWLKENKKKGFIGEFGIPDNDEQWAPVLENFLNYLKANGVGGTYWAGGPWWGDYKLNLEAYDDKDRPQMKVMEKFFK